MLDLVPRMERYRRELGAMVASADNPARAQEYVKHWSALIADDREIDAAIYRNALMADMAGQLFVREVEVAGKVPAKARALDADSLPAFLRLPFREAVEAFLRRRVMAPDEFYSLSDAYRTEAFTASRLMSDRLRERARDEIDRTLQEGGTLRDFVRAIEDEQADLGISPASHGYLEVVFRTNTAGAYGAGRYRQILEPDVADVHPYVEYRTVGDSRVRPSHAVLDGTVYRVTDSAWRAIAPPNGYQCRCSVVGLEADEGRDRVRDAPPPEGRPDPGFDAPPIIT